MLLGVHQHDIGGPQCRGVDQPEQHLTRAAVQPPVPAGVAGTGQVIEDDGHSAEQQARQVHVKVAEVAHQHRVRPGHAPGRPGQGGPPPGQPHQQGRRAPRLGQHRHPARGVQAERRIAFRYLDPADLNSGLRAFRRQVALPYLRLLPPGFSCVTTITIAFLANQHDVRYVPIGYAKRAGTSKFHFVKDAYRYILQVLRMVMYFNPLKVLMPIALALLGLGVLKGIYDLVVHPVHIADDTVLIFVSGLIIATLGLLADLIVRSRSDG